MTMAPDSSKHNTGIILYMTLRMVGNVDDNTEVSDGLREVIDITVHI